MNWEIRDKSDQGTRHCEESVFSRHREVPTENGRTKQSAECIALNRQIASLRPDDYIRTSLAMTCLFSFSFFLLFIFGTYHHTSAAGIGATPSELSFDLDVSETQNQTILVYNLSDESADFELSFDSYSDWFQLSENNFFLGPNETREVEVAVTPKTSGQFAPNLQIVSFSQAKQSINTGAGIKLKILLQVAEPSLLKKYQKAFLVAFGFLCVLALIFFLYRFFKKKNAPLLIIEE